MLRHLLFLSFALGCVAVLPAGQLYCPLTDNACSVQCAAPPPAGFSGAGGYDGSSYFFTNGAAGTCRRTECNEHRHRNAVKASSLYEKPSQVFRTLCEM